MLHSAALPEPVDHVEAPGIDERILTEGVLTQCIRRDAPGKGNTQAVLFVHGFTGNAAETWRDGGSTPFPHLICADPKLTDFDVFIFNYKTNFLRPPPIGNISQQLGAQINQWLTGRRVVLIAHSMGGLVCMQYIINNLVVGRPLPVAGLMMYGTPMTGIELLRYAALGGSALALKLPVIGSVVRGVFGNKQLRDMSRGSEYLGRLFADWVARAVNGGNFDLDPTDRIWIPVKVVTGNDDWVVPEDSAKGFYGDTDWFNVSDRSHIELVKPSGTGDVVYQYAATFLAKCGEWKPPQVLTALRQQVDWLWKQHEGKLIRNWHFNFELLAKTTLPDGTFGLPDFYSFKVTECRYTLTLNSTLSSLPFGFALDSQTAEKLWRDNFAYLHRFLFGGLDVEERKKISDAVLDVLGKPAEQAWQTLFRNPKIQLRLKSDTEEPWYELTPGSPQRRDDGIVAEFSLPAEAKHLFNREVELDVSFESIIPNPIRNFTVEFPWLCEGFDVRVSVHGSPKYLAASRYMVGNAEVDVEALDLGALQKLSISSEELIMPNSRVVLDWQR